MKPEKDPRMTAMKIALVAETVLVIILSIVVCVAVFVIVSLYIELAWYKLCETVDFTTIGSEKPVNSLIEMHEYLKIVFSEMEMIHF